MNGSADRQFNPEILLLLALPKAAAARNQSGKLREVTEKTRDRSFERPQGQ
jgi:hypothetical protein